MEEPRRLKPEPPPLAAMKPNAARLPQRTRGGLRRPGERRTENGTPLRGDGEAVVQSGDSRHPSRPIGPMCPTAASSTPEWAQGLPEWEPQIVQILADLGPATAGRTLQGSLEVWRFGGLEEPQRLNPGQPPLAAIRPYTERVPDWGTADSADFEQIKDVLSHAGRSREAWKLRGLDAWSFLVGRCPTPLLFI